MILSFANGETEQLYIAGKSRKFSAAVCKIGVRKLDFLNAATCLEDLKSPPGNRLEPLSGNYRGKHSIRINDQFRIVFSFKNGNAYDVEIIDYH